MPQTSILVQLDPAVEARLAALADERDQPVSDVAAEIITMYFAPDNWDTGNELPVPHHQRKRMTLEELMEGIPEGTVMQEIDWGPPRGAEIWWEDEK
jgi:hypothetical protein